MEFTEILAVLRRRWRWGAVVGGLVTALLVAYALLMPAGRVIQSWQEYQVTVIFVPTTAKPEVATDATSFIQSQMYSYAQVALSREVQARAYEESGVARDGSSIGGITLTYGGDNNFQLIAGSNSEETAEAFLDAWATETIETIDDTILPSPPDDVVAAEQLGPPELAYAPSETTAGTARTLALPMAPVLGLLLGMGACFVAELRNRRRGDTRVRAGGRRKRVR